MNLTDQLTVSVYLKRDVHDNGMTLQQYADAVIAGNHPMLGHDELTYQFGSTDQDMLTVTNWANKNNLTITESHNGMAVIKLTGTIDQWNQLFNISLTLNERNVYVHSEPLTIPTEIINSIENIFGLDNSVTFSHNYKTLEPDFIPNLSSTPLLPTQVAASYNFPAGTGYGGCIGLIELGGGYTTSNLNSTFQTYQGLSYTPNVVFYSVDSATNTPGLSTTSNNPSGEVVLDIAVAAGVVPRATTVVYMAPNTAQGFVDCFNAAIYDRTNNPTVLSVSWGGSETGYGSYATSMDTLFQAAATLGITILVASGDYGSYVQTGTNSYSFGVQYPSASPYVTGVGGTTLQLSGSSIGSETVWNQGNAASTGGVSTVYTSVPAWQTGKSYKTYPGAVTTTLTTRGVPDVAANGDPATGYYFYIGTDNQKVGPIGGTSAAAPLWGGLICLLNTLTGQRYGFINPVLYAQSSTTTNDITSGNNECASSPVNATTGYSATTGWDACTGVGSPNATGIYTVLHRGATYPKENYGFRPATGSPFPRQKNTARY